MAKSAKSSGHRSSGSRGNRASKSAATKLRIVAGFHGGRKIDYNGDPATRPMKEKTREAVFSLLGGYLYDTYALDLFGGTGILAFEALSRGAVQGTILELSRTAVATILANTRELDYSDRIEVHNVDTLRWLRSATEQTSGWPDIPWVVFCCPPYRMWGSDGDRLAAGLKELYELSPAGSLFVTETEKDYDVSTEIPSIKWDVRRYPPAFIGIAKRE